MGIKELEDFLYQETDSEQWHLKHEGELSHFYNKLEKVAFDSGEYYCFDFCNTLKTDTIGIVRESRYTTIPAHFHKDMELNYIYICHKGKRNHDETRGFVYPGFQCHP